MFGSKYPFGTKALYDSAIQKAVKRFADVKNYVPSKEELLTLFAYARNQNSTIRLISTLLNEIDNQGSHCRPVYRCIYAILYGMKSNLNDFVYITRHFMQEIYSVLFLTFDIKENYYARQIHLIIHAIRDFLDASKPLPEISNLLPRLRTFERKYEVEEEEDGPEIEFEKPSQPLPDLDDEDPESIDLPNAVLSSKFKPSFNPCSSQADLLIFDASIPTKSEQSDFSTPTKLEDVSSPLAFEATDVPSSPSPLIASSPSLSVMKKATSDVDVNLQAMNSSAMFGSSDNIQESVSLVDFQRYRFNDTLSFVSDIQFDDLIESF